MSQFDYDGGGYVAGSPYGSATLANGGSPGGAKKAPSHSLRACTIKQLLNATQNAGQEVEWAIGDVPLTHATTVAHVVSVSNQTTNNVYWLDDGTDRIEGRRWIDPTNEEGDDDGSGSITENSYVRTYGGLKSFGNKRYLNITHIRPVKDPHEIFFHLLEAMTNSLTHSRGPPGARPGQKNGTAAAVGSAYATQTPTAAVQQQYAHFPPLQRKIVEFMLGQTVTDDGIHVAAIARAVGGDPHEINNAIDSLMTDGHVYSTVDESHFAISI